MVDPTRRIFVTKILKTFLFSYVDSTRRLAVNLAGGGGGDLKQLMAEHSLGVKEDTSNSGISLDVVYLKQAEHLMRSDNYKTAIKYTHKALEINPEMTVSKIFQPVMRPHEHALHVYTTANFVA